MPQHAPTKYNLLLVDDDPFILEGIGEDLESRGYRVTRVNSGEKAIDVLQRTRFDLVITDQTMPDMTGFELARKLLLIRPGIPVILCTGYSDSLNGEADKDARISRLLLKPFSIREMTEAVTEALKKD